MRYRRGVQPTVGSRESAAILADAYGRVSVQCTTVCGESVSLNCETELERGSYQAKHE